MKTKIPDFVKNILHSRSKVEEFRKIPKKEQGIVLLRLPKKIVKEILPHLTDGEIFKFLKYLDLDEATDVLQVLDTKRSNELLSHFEEETKEKIELLLSFSKESAAGLMTLDFIKVDYNSKFLDVLKSARKHEKETGKFPIILVTKNNMLVGEIPLHTLLHFKKEDRVSKHYKKIPSVLYNESTQKLPSVLKDHTHDKLVVVDEENTILGLIYAHDVLHLLNEAKSLGHFAGVSKEESVLDPASFKIKNRYQWLIINLLTAFLAAFIVSLFDETISKFVLLAVYMPIVAGMGGNAATQTLAVFVRGIALEEITLNKYAFKAIFNEVLAGATNGLITGVLAALVAIFLNQSPILGLIIGVSMIINLIMAGFFGGLIPLVMKKLGKDPAASATIFITTATDVFGFLVFLGLATLLL